MPVSSSCPHCGASFLLSEKQVGAQVRCRKCNGIFQVKAQTAKSSPIATKPSPPVLQRAVPEDREPRERPYASSAPARQNKPAKKSSLLPVLLIGGALALFLFVGIGVAGVAAIVYLYSASAPVVAQDGKPEASTAPVAIAETAKDLEELKAATVFVKISAGPLRGSGSGFLIKTDGNTGYVATNYHVASPSIRGGRIRADGVDITVVFRSGTTAEHSHRAEVVAADPENDLAVLKVTGVAALPRPVNLSGASLIETLPVTVYGFPFGDRLGVNAQSPAITVSKGSVSSIRRNERNEVVAVQIDGALNPGNSGGPVLDNDGRLVGIATATITGAHIGLAVPAEELNRLLDGRVGEPSVAVKGTSGDVVEVAVETAVLDPLSRVKSVRVHYLRADRVKDNLQPEKGKDWTELPGSEQMPLQIESARAVGKIAIPAADKDRLFTFQLSFNTGNRTVYTKPRTLSVRPQDTVVVRPPNQPDRPPVLPGRGGQPDHPPGVPIKQPPPATFTVSVPDKDKKIVPLGGAVSDVTVAGGGRYLVLHESGKKKLAIFDVQEGKIAKELPLTEEPCHVAGGAERLVVIYPNAKLIQQWSLKTFEREKSAVLPGSLTSDTIHQISMGSASAGPLFVYLPKEKRTLVVNLDNLDATEVRWTNWAPNNAYGPLTMRTSPDGTWLVGYGGGWAGCEVATFKDGLQVTSNPKIDFWSAPGSFALPSADARFLFTPSGVLDHSLILAKVPDLKGCFVVPSTEPGYFLALAKQSNPGTEPSHTLDDGSVTVYSEDRKPLFVLGGLDELKTKDTLAWEKRLHYYPRASLLVTLDAGKEQLVLRRVNLAEQLEKSDTDYLMVVSRPPLAKPGADFAYKLEALSKKGGVKYKLENGPEGLKVSSAGEVSWKVPAKPVDSDVEVLVTVTDSSGQEVFHHFKVQISPP